MNSRALTPLPMLTLVVHLMPSYCTGVHAHILLQAGITCHCHLQGTYNQAAPLSLFLLNLEMKKIFSKEHSDSC